MPDNGNPKCFWDFWRDLRYMFGYHDLELSPRQYKQAFGPYHFTMTQRRLLFELREAGMEHDQAVRAVENVWRDL